MCVWVYVKISMNTCGIDETGGWVQPECVYMSVCQSVNIACVKDLNYFLFLFFFSLFFFFFFFLIHQELMGPSLFPGLQEAPWH